MLEIKKATVSLANDLSYLFDCYRQFYKMPSNISACKQFILQRLKQKDSHIWIAYQNQKSAGFTQIYSAFSSVAMQPIWLLNDLYIDVNYRRQGLGKKLIQTVEKAAIDNNIFAVKLATEKSNIQAQNLYNNIGFSRLDNFHHYTKKLS